MMTGQPPSSMAPCVILAPADHTMDDRLPGLLAERGWSPRIEHDARMAMAEACLVRRDLRIQHAWDTEEVVLPGILIITPSHCNAMEAFQSALRMHVPDIPLWRYEDGIIVSLDEGEPQESAENSTEPRSLPFRPEPLTHDEVSMLLHGRRDPEST